ncbi:StbB family protein [Pseudomonas savastanoi]|uniref:StbB family protein n=3 Tax=Pseudomonas syringae group genomosp. 2 TaxID=251698 RepID=UPI0005C9B6E4|nr:StbB family protein [Pseudomonas savastanoi]PAB30444.1 plasmid stability protein StbB [Pseudomonas savastanoi]
MKVVIINYTGTVGKTTIAANLLSPRMDGAPIYAIESINETAENLGLDVEKLRGNKFRELFKRLMLEDNAIIDVGASNVEDFMSNLEGFEEAHEEIDYYIVPVTSGTKEQKETVSMIGSLASMGVPSDKIRVVFNRVKRDVQAEFPIITAYHERASAFRINYQCAIFESELFDALSINRLSMKSLMEDETDYKTLLKDKDASVQDRNRWSDMYGLKLLCKGVNRKLDSVFAELFDIEVIK